MDINGLLKKAIKSKKTALSEKESKQLIKEYGVPVISETVVNNGNEAVKVAETIGFPVVLKGLGANLMHKTDRGLVHLNLSDAQSVKKASQAIVEEAGNELEGLLIQPQIEGKREFVAGMFQDKLFGPVIMFGLGGIFTEALSDTTFRVAPLAEPDAAEMIDEIKTRSLLGDFRGEKAADRNQLIQTLMGLSEIGVEHPEITEIDINPLLVNPEGNVSAVDALVVVGKKKIEKQYLPPIDPDSIGALFYPRSIAFVGASAQIGKWGHMLLTNTISGGFEGEIYLVNPKGGTIANRKVYKSVVDIPEKVDIAIVTIPASMVMDLIPPFKAKGINKMLLITSGFGETGKDGKELEKELVIKAAEAGIHVIGPNTMGICNPHINFYCTASSAWPRPGSTTIAAQSGNMGTQLLYFAEQQDIGIRGYCGSGNEAMITIEDYLDAFENDALTKTVMLYVESVKNGRRFFESARRVGKKKPIVLLKGGQSKVGSRAAASHTGAMASDSRVFDAVCHQAGVVKVDQPMDLLDLSAAFSSLPLPQGNRAAIMTLGGGWGVVTADLCSKYELEVPELSPDVLKKLDTMLPPYWSRSNPLDLVGEGDFLLMLTVIEELVKWDGCDAVITLGILGRKIIQKRLTDAVLNADPDYSAEFLDSINQEVSDFEKHFIEHIIKLMEKHKKPVFGVSFASGRERIVHRVSNSPLNCVFYPSPERAVKSLSKMYEYQRFLTRY